MLVLFIVDLTTAFQRYGLCSVRRLSYYSDLFICTGWT